MNVWVLTSFELIKTITKHMLVKFNSVLETGKGGWLILRVGATLQRTDTYYKARDRRSTPTSPNSCMYVNTRSSIQTNSRYMWYFDLYNGLKIFGILLLCVKQQRRNSLMSLK